MRITKEQLRQIIKEELEAVMSEEEPSSFRVLVTGLRSEQRVLADAMEDLETHGANEGEDYEKVMGPSGELEGIVILNKSHADSVRDALNADQMRYPDEYRYDMQMVDSDNDPI